MQTKEEIGAVWNKDREIEAIVDEDKVIRANIRWQRSEGGNFRFTVGVLVPSSNLMLKLSAFKGKRNYSFALLYNNRPIRMYTCHNYQPHPNPDGQKIMKPHKHMWDQKHHDKLAYVSDDIAGGDINIELDNFLRDCNVRRAGALEAFLL